MRRHATGVIAVVLLLLAAWFYVWPPTGPVGQELQAAFGRIGVVMAVIWLAYDQLKRMPRWLLWTIPLLAIAFVLPPLRRYLLILVPLVIVLAILRPRTSPRRP
jgi:drug/metabolite transporter superfamily protein YnfA